MSTMKFLDFHDLSAYKLSHELSNMVWFIVIKWNYFAKDTIGKQLPKEINSLIKYTNYNLKD